jgi:predicted glycosyltransferase
MQRPVLLVYCQHSLGMGHLVRTLALARGLADRFHVVLLNGGRFPDGMRVPSGVTVVDLPPLGMTEVAGVNTLVSLDPARDVPAAFTARRAMLLDTLARTRPAAIVIELFPFGRKKFAEELEPFLAAAHALDPRPRVVCSLRDILVGSRHDQQRHDDRAGRTVNRWFDAVLVHADARFARLDETFHPTEPLTVPVHHTGFVLDPDVPVVDDAQPRAPRVLVHAGGGMVGLPLYLAAVDAQRRLVAAGDWPHTMRIVAGPFLPEADWNTLVVAAAAMPTVELVRALPSLREELATAAVSVSQCGYNTALDIAAARVSALVIPFAVGREDEQRRRAHRLAALGAVRVLEPEALDGATLAAALRAQCAFRPAPIAVDLDGAAHATKVLAALVEEAAPAGGTVAPAGVRVRPRATAAPGAWLAPVTRALAARPDVATCFFRDDDAGPMDDALLRLVDLFQLYRLPLDLAVVPAALDPDLALLLRDLARVEPGLLGLHQHGFDHANHEATGRKCEFGPSRGAAVQQRDLAAGRARLATLLGVRVDPFFTPPWNRCTQDTVDALVTLGFTMLSRDRGATPFATAGLHELPVDVDWVKLARGAEPVEAAERIAAAITEHGSAGIMLHHAAMTEEQFVSLERLLACFSRQPRLAPRPMRALLPAVPPTQRAPAAACLEPDLLP